MNLGRIQEKSTLNNTGQYILILRNQGELTMIQTNTHFYIRVRFRIDQMKLIFLWKHLRHLTKESFRRYRYTQVIIILPFLSETVNT